MATNAVHDEGCKDWTKEKIIMVLRVAAVCGNVAVGIYSVFNLMALSNLNVVTAIMDLYLTILSFMCLLAELRFVGAIRSVAYTLLKWFYFLTSYTGRGLFYFFMGTLMLDGDSAWSTFIAVVMMSIGLMWLIVSRFYGLESPADKITPGGAGPLAIATPKPAVAAPKPVAPAPKSESDLYDEVRRPTPAQAPVSKYQAPYSPPYMPQEVSPVVVTAASPPRPSYPYQVEEHPNPFANPN